MNFQSKPEMQNGVITAILKKYWIVIFLIIYVPVSYLIYGHAKLFDDNFIYLQYAKHFIEHGELSFNTGEKIYAFTSPLWQILYIIVYYFIRSEYIAPFLSISFALLTILTCYFLLKDYFKQWSLLFPVMLIIAFDPVFIKHIYNGMETSLVSLLSYIIIAGIILTGKIKKESLLGLIFGLFMLVRLESLILSLLAIIYLILKGELKLKGGLKIVLSALAVCLPWFMFVFFYFGRILPDTFGAKGADYPLGMSFYKNIFDIAKIFGGNYIFLFIISLISLNQIKGFFNTFRLKYFLVCLIVIIYALFYSLVITGENVYARYLCIAAPVIIFLYILFISYSEENIYRLRIKYYIAAFLLIASSIFYSGIDKQLVESTKIIQSSVVTWVSENTQKDSYISYATIGELGYYTQRRIFDPQGLINREISGYYREGKIVDYYLLKKPDYLIDVPEETVNKLRDHAKVELKKEFIVDLRYLLRHKLSHRASTYTMRVYKIEYN
jgi:hypothetical protein